jgi:hypothetical protein
MFESYTAKSRRVIFYARYEASNYGSTCIETEHLLLGLLREDIGCFPGEGNIEAEIRAELENQITRKERSPISVEIPLSPRCKEVLTLAAETSERLGHRVVEPDHLLIAILRAETSLAAQILFARGIRLDLVEAQAAKRPGTKYRAAASISASLILDSFLAGLKCLKPDELIDFFAKNGEYLDTDGKRWNREEIWKGFKTFFAHYAKKNVSYFVEARLAETSELLVATVLWKNALLASERRIHRMSVVLVTEAGEWKILLLQMTGVRLSAATAN